MSSNDFLLKDARELVATAEASEPVRAYRARLPLGQIWQWNEPMKHRALSATSSADALAHLQTALFVHSKSRPEAELAVNWALAHRGLGPGIVTASRFAPEDSTVEVGHHRYWHDDARHVGHMLALMRHVKKLSLPYGPEPVRIVELGAGAGNLARLVKEYVGKRLRYTIIDLPDTLAFAMMFLRANFPDASWGVIGAGDQITDDTEFVFCPVGMEDALLTAPRADAFVNTASLGEMKMATVQHWFNFVERMQIPLFLSVNRFLNRISLPTHSWRLDENGSWLCFTPDKWTIAEWELEPEFLRNPWQNRHARQVLIAATLGPEPVFSAGIEMGKLLTALDHASYNHGPHELSCHAPALATDFTQTGLLFKAWQALRWSWGNSTEATSRFLGYLSHLNGIGGPHFEEFFQLTQGSLAARLKFCAGGAVAGSGQPGAAPLPSEAHSRRA